MKSRKISSTTYPIIFSMTRSGSPITGLTPTVLISKNGGGFISPSGSIVEVGNGFYSLSANIIDRNTLGELKLYITSASTNPTYESYDITSYDPFSTVKETWDELLSASTHNVPTSAGRRLRQLASNVVLDGIVTGATINTISFDGDASTLDGAYDPAIATITSGLAIGQSRLIYQYNGSTKTAILDRDWKVIPSPGDECIIFADAGREHVNEGLIRSGSAISVQLNTYASNNDDEYVGQVIFIRSGTGADQACRVVAYNGTTKIATMAHAWRTIPDNTSAYVMLPTGVLDLDGFVELIWSYTSRTLTAVSNIASSIWSYITRTLTYSPQNLASITDGDLAFLRGDTIDYTFSNLDLTNYASSFFTIKKNHQQDDCDSIIQVSSASGLVYLNGVKVSTGSANASIISGSASLTVKIAASLTKQFPYSSDNYYYDLQVITASGSVTTPELGEIAIIRDVTKRII